MLRRSLNCFSALLCVGAFAACGSDDGSTGDGNTPEEAQSRVDDAEEGARPPTLSSSAGDASGDDVTWAIDALFLGETDWDGNRSQDAWKDIGYNLDGIVSTKLGSNHCKFVAGANKTTVQADGTDGIDNSFGKNITPFIDRLQPDPSIEVTKAVEDGDFTIMLRTRGLGPEADQKDVWAALYAGAEFGEKPAWDGTDVWDVYKELLNNDDVESPKVVFENSYVSDHTWVSGSEGTVDLSVSIQGFEVTLRIINAIITMEMDSENSEVARGVISGVLETQSFISELQKVAGSFDESLCEGSLFDSIASQIRQSSDIMDDGTNGNPDITCNAISVGLGFTAKRVILGAAVDSPPEGEPACP
jgi:hypothetical protein